MSKKKKFYIYSVYPDFSPLEYGFQIFASLLSQELKCEVKAVHDQSIKNITQHFCMKKSYDNCLLLTGFGPAILDPLYTKVDYKPYKDLFFISPITKMPILFYSNPKEKAKTFLDMVKDLKENPKKEIGIGYPFGGSPHFVSSYIASLFQIQPSFSTKNIHNLAHGEISFACYHPFADEQEVLSNSQCRALAQYGNDKQYYPSVPSLTELGIPLQLSSWRALAAPKKIPIDIATQLNIATNNVLNSPCFQLALEKTHESPYGLNIHSTKDWVESQHLYCKSIMRKTKKFL